MLQIILMHPRLKRARTINITRRAVLVTCLGGLLAFSLSTGLLSYVTVKASINSGLPFVAEKINALAAKATKDSNKVAQQNIDALAVKLGQIQAQMMRVDALSERVANMTGVKIQDLQPGKTPGRGGALSAESRALNLSELSTAVDEVGKRIDQRTDQLQQVEFDLISSSVRSKLLPSSQPLQDGFVGSAFGVRIDPFTGRSTRHDGIDFSAPPGTPIRAAAGGVVVAAELHPAYGNMVDVDHGNRLVTRYAHAQKLLVKQGDIVRQGQALAEVGSTGRSTGPHLHFEVRVEGEAMDPRKYLESGLGFVGNQSAKR
jgi:murein DD-endopeptidase MepM/ murein hydrolase activator NlpD